MKRLLYIFILLMPYFGQCQWKFKAGDSLDWAKSNYDNRHWKKATLALRDNKALWKAKKGWFRLQFNLSQQALKTNYSLILKQFDHSELYLDGQLVATTNTSNPQDSASQLRLMPLPLAIKGTNTYVIALRYSFRAAPLYYASTDEDAFKLWPEPSPQSMLNQLINTAWNAGVSGMLAGLFGILSLLHFLFFALIPTNGHT